MRTCQQSQNKTLVLQVGGTAAEFAMRFNIGFQAKNIKWRLHSPNRKSQYHFFHWGGIALYWLITLAESATQIWLQMEN
jgi:hypothetical protein